MTSSQRQIVPKRDEKTLEVKIEDTTEAVRSFVSSLYDLSDISQDELSQFYELYRFKGFNRDKMLAKLYEKVKDKKLAIQLILLCALRGPLGASQIKLLNGLSPQEIGIPGSGQMRTENLSCARINAATADLAAFLLKKVNVPKRLPSHPCPAWLQFPSAGSIRMPDDMREMHIDFSKKFSVVIGGQFREEIYAQMVANAYLDPKLHLFD
jgi:hypothetical protein